MSDIFSSIATLGRAPTKVQWTPSDSELQLWHAVDPLSVDVLANCLQRNRTINEVHLPLCSDAGLAALANAMSVNDMVTHLEFARCSDPTSFSVAGLTNLMNSFHHRHTLRTLNFFACPLSDEVVSALAAALSELGSLRRLEWTRSEISDEGARAIAAALASEACLIEHVELKQVLTGLFLPVTAVPSSATLRACEFELFV